MLHFLAGHPSLSLCLQQSIIRHWESIHRHLRSTLPLVERICVGPWWGGWYFPSRRLTWVFQLLSQNCRHAATFHSNRYLSMGYVLRIKTQLTETHRPQSATFRLWSRCVSSCVFAATRQGIEVVVCGEMLRRCGFFGRGVGVKCSPKPSSLDCLRIVRRFPKINSYLIQIVGFLKA